MNLRQFQGVIKHGTASGGAHRLLQCTVSRFAPRTADTQACSKFHVQHQQCSLLYRFQSCFATHQPAATSSVTSQQQKFTQLNHEGDYADTPSGLCVDISIQQTAVIAVTVAVEGGCSTPLVVRECTFTLLMVVTMYTHIIISSVVLLPFAIALMTPRDAGPLVYLGHPCFLSVGG